MSIKRSSTFTRLMLFLFQGCAESCQSPTTACLASAVPPQGGQHPLGGPFLSTSGMQVLFPLTSAQTQAEPFPGWGSVPAPAPLWGRRGCSDKQIKISSNQGLRGRRDASPPRQALLVEATQGNILER